VEHGVILRAALFALVFGGLVALAVYKWVRGYRDEAAARDELARRRHLGRCE
jgi:hypothetical protein